jgi:hypothetical protein
LTRKISPSSPAASILTFLVALFILGNFPSLFLALASAYILLMVVLMILTYMETKKKMLDEKKFWNMDAVFERRMKSANEVGAWSGKAELEAVTARLENNGFAGKIKTTTGKELWRCKHQHRSKKKPGTTMRSKRSRYGPPINLSYEAALRCARKELVKNYILYSSMVDNSIVEKRGSSLSRSKLKNDPHEPIEKILNTFGDRCAYCGVYNLTKEITHQDHVLPLAKGGSNLSSNMLPTCMKCNMDKGDKSVFDFLLELESSGKTLPTWVDASETWQKFKNQ